MNIPCAAFKFPRFHARHVNLRHDSKHPAAPPYRVLCSGYYHGDAHSCAFPEALLVYFPHGKRSTHSRCHTVSNAHYDTSAMPRCSCMFLLKAWMPPHGLASHTTSCLIGPAHEARHSRQRQQTAGFDPQRVQQRNHYKIQYSKCS